MRQRSLVANNSTEVRQRSPAPNAGITKPSGNYINIQTRLDISQADFKEYKVVIKRFKDLWFILTDLILIILNLKFLVRYTRSG